MSLHENLRILLESCARCTDSTRGVWLQACESRRISRIAISASKELLRRSDQTIDCMKRLTEGAAAHAELQETSLEKDSLEIITGKEVRAGVVILDQKHFVNCTFTNCTLQYGGGSLILESTSCENCTFQFHGEAAMTVQLLELFGMMQANDTLPSNRGQQLPN